MIRRIAHLDMDAFYASVELLRYPQLKGLPVVIGGGRRREDDLLARVRQQYPEREWGSEHLSELPVDVFPRLGGYTGRGVITTATYAARAFGVGSAMGLMKAAQRCPKAILLPVDFEQYRHYSRLFKGLVRDIAPVIEDRGVDEIYIDFTDVPGGQREGGRVLARLIQKTITDVTGLTCSIGVAPNKLLAKMASELNKPQGISIVFEEEIAEKIWPLACRKINGIGPKAEAKLQALGIHTIGDLARQDRDGLIQHFGKSHGAWLHDAAHGIDERPVVTESEPVSMSRETTFDKDLHVQHDREALGHIFTRLCQQVAADLQRKGYVGKTIGVKLRFDNFQSVTRDSTMTTYTADATRIRHAAGQCLKRIAFERRIRLLGVRVGSLIKADHETLASSPMEKGVSSAERLQEPTPLKDASHAQADLF